MKRLKKTKSTNFGNNMTHKSIFNWNVQQKDLE